MGIGFMIFDFGELSGNVFDLIGRAGFKGVNRKFRFGEFWIY